MCVCVGCIEHHITSKFAFEGNYDEKSNQTRKRTTTGSEEKLYNQVSRLGRKHIFLFLTKITSFKKRKRKLSGWVGFRPLNELPSPLLPFVTATMTSLRPCAFHWYLAIVIQCYPLRCCDTTTTVPLCSVTTCQQCCFLPLLCNCSHCHHQMHCFTITAAMSSLPAPSLLSYLNVTRLTPPL